MCAGTALALTTICTQGFVALPVRWQITALPPDRGVAVGVALGVTVGVGVEHVILSTSGPNSE